MKAIIFGANSQDGYYLTHLLDIEKIEVVGISRSDGNWLKGDVTNRDFVENIIRFHQPDFIFNFAAISSTHHDVSIDNHTIISTGSLNILESAYKHCKHSKIFLSGSALQFKNVGMPINEKTEFEASSSYAAERIYTTYLARYYREKGIHVSVGFLFNHESPLRPNHFVSAYIASSVKKIKDGYLQRLEIGDLNVTREWNFAGDFAKAILLLMKQNDIYELVIGSGKSHTIKDWVEACFSFYGLNWEEYVVSSQNYNAEYKRLVSDPTILFSLGYKPEYDIVRLARIMLGEQ